MNDNDFKEWYESGPMFKSLDKLTESDIKTLKNTMSFAGYKLRLELGRFFSALYCFIVMRSK